ncbi:hypothetical protein [Janibacter cremeus]|uniref:Uncharacterized protein n=1 Tax=Janibacter cremeus TaxID=1285192 RepID=A0A852VT95_9MICO|nr:hypothetical protein [Janibacter cremeus]NYF99209.1 hypothetical protein [Janibacter cremeus]
MTTKTSTKKTTSTHGYVQDVADLTLNQSAIDEHREAVATAAAEVRASAERVQDTTDALDDLRADAGAAGANVTGADIAAARAEIEAAELAQAGAVKRQRSLSRQKIVTDLDYITAAEPAVSRLLDGLAPTYYGVGAAPTRLPDGMDLPALLLTHEADTKPVDRSGREEAVLTLSWFRNSLTRSMDEFHVREVFESTFRDAGTVRARTGREVGDGVYLDVVSVTPAIAPEIPKLMYLPRVGKADYNAAHSIMQSHVLPHFGTYEDGMGVSRRRLTLHYLANVGPDAEAQVKSVKEDNGKRSTEYVATMRYTLAPAERQRFGREIADNVRRLRELPAYVADAGKAAVGMETPHGRITECKATVENEVEGSMVGQPTTATVRITYTAQSRV